MTDPFDDLKKMWNETADEYIAWQKTKQTQSLDDLFQTVKKILSKGYEIIKYEDDIKSLTTGNKTAALAAQYKNLYEMYWFLSEVLLELLRRVISGTTKENNPVREFLDPRIKSMIVEQVRIEVAKELKKSKVKHDTKRKKKSLKN